MARSRTGKWGEKIRVENPEAAGLERVASNSRLYIIRVNDRNGNLDEGRTKVYTVCKWKENRYIEALAPDIRIQAFNIYRESQKQREIRKRERKDTKGNAVF